MLDTVALSLDSNEFEILEPGRFSPSAAGLLHSPYYPLGGRGNFSCYLNPTKADVDAGRYLPRLTLSRRKVRGGFALSLKVELSLPKLVFGNNFDELASREFDRVVAALKCALGGMGVRVDDYTLRAARVSAIHYSKNIAFVDYTTCSMVMRELNLVDLNGRLDLSHTDYRNEGHAIRYHANSFELTFYDKMRDLAKARYSEKRAVERDNRVQLGLFDDRPDLPRQLEVLRMEVRLGNRAKITGLLKRLGEDRAPTFAALFDGSVARGVLVHFWDQIRRQLPLAGQAGRLRPEDVLAALAKAERGAARPGAMLQRLGCIMLAASVGVRGAGAIMSRHCSARTWQRYKRDLGELEWPATTSFSALAQVGAELDRFEPLRLSDFQCAGRRQW